MNINKWTAAGIVAVIFVLGMLFGRWNFTTTTTVAEKAKPAVTQSATALSPNGSLILRVAPDVAAEPAQAIPKRDVVERVAQATIKPKVTSVSAQKDCPPVTVDMSLVREPDGGKRFIVSSPDGDVVGGFDVPKTPIVITVVHHWAAGGSYGSDKTYGAWLDRDVGRLRFGAEVNQMPDGGIGARLRIGFTLG